MDESIPRHNGNELLSPQPVNNVEVTKVGEAPTPEPLPKQTSTMGSSKAGELSTPKQPTATTEQTTHSCRVPDAIPVMPQSRDDLSATQHFLVQPSLNQTPR